MRGLSPEAVRHVYLLAILPIMTYAAHALHLTRTDIKTMESTHGNIIKSTYGLSKYSRTSPLIASLDIQRVESVINNQTINLLRRCLMGDSLASQLYWTLYKQGELDDKTLIGRASHSFACLTLLDEIIGVNISERKSGTEWTKKRKKRELVCFPTARGRNGVHRLSISAKHGFCPSYDILGYLYPGPYAVRTKSQLNSKQNTQHFRSLKRELALPSTGSWLPSRLSST